MAAPVWKPDPEKHDFPAAEDFLDLLFTPDAVANIVHRLQHGKTVVKKAKDVLRASRLPLLAEDNLHVAHNIDKVSAGRMLSPVLLVRGQPLLIADGYHRVCAIYYLSEDLDVPCRLA
ncbi:hypothetical protein [Streptodolium elevatio]|uniref:ParB/Sulfiredoxin domain-containing protein n=1 Tax=Streptodolium elevatio TaxID=3157996 RepID=A0ABV3DGG5_9ACTN